MYKKSVAGCPSPPVPLGKDRCWVEEKLVGFLAVSQEGQARIGRKHEHT
tara:strand:- start:129 stop:275 length:147 start_codon:yes stop_codon:yes gene_type:complete